MYDANEEKDFSDEEIEKMLNEQARVFYQDIDE